MTEEIKETVYKDVVSLLKQKKNIFPKNTTTTKKIEKLKKILEYATIQEYYEDCVYIRDLINSIMPKHDNGKN